MATKISWVQNPDGSRGETWNPIRARNKETGGVGHFCVHVSPGCENCYAERMQRRFNNPVRYAAQDRDKVDLYLDEKVLTQPLRWRKPRMIFPCSMTDLFADFVPDEWIDQVFAVMALAPQHTFQPLTKRPERMRAYLTDARAHPVGLEALGLTMIAMAKSPRSEVGSGVTLQGDIAHLSVWPLPNVWLGVSAEDQARAEERIPVLLDTPAAVRWVSVEPMLEDINLEELDFGEGNGLNAVDALSRVGLEMNGNPPYQITTEKLDWVVCGAESGPNRRPFDDDWARSLRDQCQNANVPFFFKQTFRDGRKIETPELDGRQWTEFPR